jgi:hypothetical protein
MRNIIILLISLFIGKIVCASAFLSAKSNHVVQKKNFSQGINLFYGWNNDFSSVRNESSSSTRLFLSPCALYVNPRNQEMVTNLS